MGTSRQFAVLASLVIVGLGAGFAARARYSVKVTYSFSDIVAVQKRFLILRSLDGCSVVLSVPLPLDVKELQAVDDPLEVPGLREIARENDVNRRALPAPLLIVHGSDDKIVEYYRSVRLCPQIIGLPRQGPTQMVTYINEDHYTISLAAARDMADWIRDRFAGEEMTEVGCDKRRDTIVGDVADFFRGARGAYNAVRDFFGNLGRSIGDFFGGLFG